MKEWGTIITTILLPFFHSLLTKGREFSSEDLILNLVLNPKPILILQDLHPPKKPGTWIVSRASQRLQYPVIYLKL